MDSEGEPRPRSISEVWGERVTRSLVMRLLCGAWLVPAASLIWVGLAATDLRHASEASQAIALGRTQATAILLAVPTILIGACVFVRQLADDVVGLSETTIPPQAQVRPSSARWVCSHALAVVLAAGVAVAASVVASEAAAVILPPLAAGLGFWAALLLPRILLRHVGGWSSPLVVLAAGIGFQLTVGWLHLANPTAALAPALIVEGLILAWVAASAARIDPFAAVPVSAAVLADEIVADAVAIEAVSAGRVASAAPEPSGFAPRPAKPSIPEAMAGR